MLYSSTIRPGGRFSKNLRYRNSQSTKNWHIFLKIFDKCMAETKWIRNHLSCFSRFINILKKTLSYKHKTKQKWSLSFHKMRWYILRFWYLARDLKLNGTHLYFLRYLRLRCVRELGPWYLLSCVVIVA